MISGGKTGFVGSKAIAEAATHNPQSIRRGLVLDMGIPRHGFEVEGPSGSVGTVTSGGFSPIIKKGIALCRVAYNNSTFGTKVSVDVRDARQGATVTKPPFFDERLYGWKREKGN